LQSNGGESGDQSFPRSARLTRPADFQRVFSGATRFGDRHFTILAKANTADRARLGLAVSKRVSNSAVKRNRIKRLIRESFRQVRGRLPAHDFVVIAKPPARDADNATLLKAMQRQWKRIQATASESSAS
jgi:ribonuclease P protein component